ncbi:MAG: hypothetical protein V3S24_12565 [Candidatus Tectomicrobia bacterium]
MDMADAQQFLRNNACAVLAPWRRDGGVQMSPLTVGLDAEGRAIMGCGGVYRSVGTGRGHGRDPVMTGGDGALGRVLSPGRR